MIANSAVKLNIEKPPDDVMDDNTKEINRLQFKVRFQYASLGSTYQVFIGV
jgi:hypothetical protein